MRKVDVGFRMVFTLLLFSVLIACNNDDEIIDESESNNEENNEENNEDGNPDPDARAIFVLMDEESIDDGEEPNNFSELDVNDNVSKIGQRQTLAYFKENPGKEITLYSGQTGDEGWFVLKEVPDSWSNAGPTQNGLRNFLDPGPGLGLNESEDLLDEIPEVTPLRATGLAMLTGQTIIALAFDSDISINYDPLEGNLQGENLGVLAFEVLKVSDRNDSGSSLPSVDIRILEYAEVEALKLHLFTNAPVPESSSEPEDTNPPATIPGIELSPVE